MSKQGRAVFCAPIVMLDNIVAEWNAKLVQLHGGEQSCAVIGGLLVNALVFADFDADALVVASMSSRVPADFVDRQALIDGAVIHREVPRDLPLLSVGSFLILKSVGACVGPRGIIVGVMDGDLRRLQRCPRAVAVTDRYKIDHDIQLLPGRLNSNRVVGCCCWLFWFCHMCCWFWFCLRGLKKMYANRLNENERLSDR